MNRRGVFIPCALGLALLLLVLGVMGASATSAGRRTLEVSRSARWVRLAAASAFDETVARVIDLSRSQGMPMPSGPDDTRDFSSELKWLVAKPVPTTLTGQAFRDESVQVSAVSFKTGPWKLQASEGPGQRKIRESGIVELSVTVTVSRAGQPAKKRVTVQRYAIAVPLPPLDGETPGFAVVISPQDLYHQEEAL